MGCRGVLGAVRLLSYFEGDPFLACASARLGSFTCTPSCMGEIRCQMENLVGQCWRVETRSWHGTCLKLGRRQHGSWHTSWRRKTDFLRRTVHTFATGHNSCSGVVCLERLCEESECVWPWRGRYKYANAVEVQSLNCVLANWLTYVSRGDRCCSTGLFLFLQPLQRGELR